MFVGNGSPGNARRVRNFSHRPLVEALESRTLLSFAAPRSYDAGPAPVSVAVADLNGDGIPDLVVPNSGSGTISILLGNGDGTFQAAQSFPVPGIAPQAVAVGDFNGDHIPDLAVANSDYLNGTLNILLGNGNGTFQAGQNYAVGAPPFSVAVGDFNGDGKLDLAVGNVYTNSVSILLGNGDGTFQAAQSYPVGAAAFSIAVGDFNGDGFPDLVVANELSNTVSVLLGNGTGMFQKAQHYAVGVGAISVAVGSFNGDGNLDLAVANVFTNSVSVLLGNGDGSFQAAQNYLVGASPFSVAVGDFTNDHILDLAVANFGSGTVSVLLGNGNGSFQPALNYAAGPYPLAVAVGDFNNDGFPDLVVANQTDTVTVLLNGADWSGGQAATASRGTLLASATDRPAVFILGAALASPAEAPQILIPLNTPPEGMRHEPLPTVVAQPPLGSMRFLPRSLGTARLAQDRVFEQWRDSFHDVFPSGAYDGESTLAEES